MIYEYIDTSLLTATIMSLLLIPIIGSKKNGTDALLKIFVLLLIAINIFAPFDAQSTAEENIKAFNTHVSIKCKSNEDSYLVSLKNGWSTKKNFFIKESLMIRADRCELY